MLLYGYNKELRRMVLLVIQASTLDGLGYGVFGPET